MRSRRRSDEGIAMLFVIAIGLVVTGLIVAMFATVLQTQSSARTQRNITSAEAAAEAGINDAVFKLGQYTAGVSNWTKYTSGASQWTQTNAFTPAVGSIGANTSYSVWITPMSGSSNMILWARGTYGTNSRLIRAQITQGAPPAFDYSMFASKGIDIHHHSSYLSPQVYTTSVHSNGYINLDYPSEFTVNSLEAVTSLTFGKGGGSTPGGTIPASGYNWYDPLNGKCYPGGMASPGGGTPVNAGNCSGNPKYSANAVIYGTVKAGSVSLNTHGQVLPVSTQTTLDTGQVIQKQDGDVYAASATIGSNTFSTKAAGDACTSVCNKGTNGNAAQISGALHIDPTYKVDTIAFPSIDYSTTYRPKAQAEQNASGVQHVFTGSGTFLNYITNPTSGFYRTIDPTTHELTTWTSGSGVAPDVIFLDGDFDITSGQAQLNYNTIGNLVHAATGTNGATPMLVIRGSLVVEGGGITLGTGLVMVGPGNRTDFLTPGSSTSPVIVDTTKLLDPTATGPAVLAAGGSINSSDYDTDSNWTSTSSYEPLKANPTYIRGLVYSASWDPSTQSSVPQSQHWHNFDPKNLQKIYGAQVGAQLHDCNNFSFSYDPLVKNAFGFGGGTVQVVDYQDLGK
jgi:hypothetical protein